MSSKKSSSSDATSDGSDLSQRIFAIDVLRSAAGDKVFERGVGYHEEGLVEIFSLGAARVRARVIGTEPYMVDLAINNGALDGRCTCPAHRDFGFCKHMVAAGLAANDAAGQGELSTGDGLDPIRKHLDTLTPDMLRRLILDFAESDPGILRKLSLTAALVTGDEKAIARKLKREITAATKIRGYVEYDEAPDWAANVGDVLDALTMVLGQGQGRLVMELALVLIDRLEQALEKVDDSDGEVGDLLARSAALHRDACNISKPNPIVLARDLFKREMDGDFGFEDTINGYRTILGKAGRSEMGRLAAEVWAKIPASRYRKNKSGEDGGFEQGRLATILDHLAAEQGDTDTRVAIRAKHLTTPAQYVALARFCDEQGRSPEAISWAEEALFVFEDAPDERLATFAAEIYSKHGRKADAEHLLWRMFERRPSLALYQQAASGLKGGARTAAADRAIVIVNKLATAPSKSVRWHSDGDLVVSILMNEERWADAWRAATAMKCSERLLERLAQASEASHPREASAIYRQRVETVLGQGGSHNYHQAKELLGRMRAIAVRIGEDDSHAIFQRDIVMRHRAKRNFIKLMEQQESDRLSRLKTVPSAGKPGAK